MPSIEFRVKVSGFMSQVICPEASTWTGLQAMQTKHVVKHIRTQKSLPYLYSVTSILSN